MENSIQTSLKNGLKVSLDWLAFTVTSDKYDTFESVANLFGLNPIDFIIQPKGSYGYKSRFTHNSEVINILTDGNEDMGIHVSCSASSLLYFVESFRETLITNTPFGSGYDYNTFDNVLVTMFDVISSIGSFSRLDIALDDVGVAWYSLDEFYDILMDPDRICTRYRTFGSNLSRNFDDKRTKQGHTLTLGSRDTDCYLRIYDKQLEQAKKRGVAPDQLPPWVRWELEIKGHETCMKIVNHLVNGQNLGSLFCGILSNKMRIVNTGNTRRERCETDPKWEQFICSAEKLSISVPKAEKSLDSKREWIRQQVAPTLSALVQSEHGDLTNVKRLIDSGDLRMNNNLRSMVKKKLRENEWEQKLPFREDYDI